MVRAAEAGQVGWSLSYVAVPIADIGVVPIKRETVQTRVYRGMREVLMRGRLLPDQAVKISDMAVLFGTSAQPVREAIRQLVAENALAAEPNRTARVPVIDAAKLEDLRHARLAIEGATAALAAERIARSDLAALEDLLRRESEADDDADPETSVAQNQAFHFLLYRLSGSEILPPIIEGLWLQIGPYLRRIAETFDARGGRGTEFHAAIVDALGRRDAAGAREALGADINRSCDLILDALAGEAA